MLYRWWMKFVHVLGTINMYVILTLFFILLAPLGIVIRIMRWSKDRKPVDSFWIPKEKQEPTLDTLKRTF
jgi:hypothetical protein